MEILKGFFDSLQSSPMYLNNTQTKSIQVCFDPEKLPNMIPAFKLNSHDHKCHITFSRETMNAITRKADEIRRCLREEEEKLFFLNDELKVFSELMHGQCAVCFLNFQGVRINILYDTFRKMMGATQSIFLKLTEIEQKLLNSAKNLKQLFDTLLAKFDQCNINSPEYQGFLQQLQQYVSSFGQGSSTSSDENNVEKSNDDEDEHGDEYEEEYHYRRRRRYGHYDHYDEYNEDMGNYWY